MSTCSAAPCTRLATRISTKVTPAVQTAASKWVKGPGCSSDKSVPTQVRQNTALGDGVPQELALRFGVVDGVVQAAALAAAGGRRDDEPGHGRDVTELEQVAVDQVLPVVLADLFLEQRDAPRRAPQALIAAHDTDVVPHRAPE